MHPDLLSKSVMETITSLLAAQSVDLVEMQLQQRRGRWLIRVFADKEGGITLEDCRRLSLEIGQSLEAENLIPTAYVLEVSSPGLDRPLRTARDFQRQCQHLITVFLHTPVLEKLHYTGRITAVTEAHIVLQLSSDTPLTIPLSHIDHGVIELEFK